MNRKKQLKEWAKEAAEDSRIRFVEMRKYYDLSQEELAEASGVHVNTIYNIESGKKNLTEGEHYAYSRAASEFKGKRNAKSILNGSFFIDSYKAFKEFRKNLGVTK